MSELRPIAIYLPQFHPVPENDEWWGKGFTEWTNVTKAKPRFKGHYQPHLPADLGFYDLRVHQTQIDQAELAKKYGIYGFCFYHYWFNGKRILERPLEEMLNKGTPDFPFCLCWANESWTKRWDGRDEDVLLKQEYSDEDDKQHINFLKKYFSDPRYIRVNGKPVFIVYRPSLFPDIKKTIECWRKECRENGVGEIYLAFMQSFGNFKDPAELGFDAAIEFQPNFSALPKEITIGSGPGNFFKRFSLLKKSDKKQSTHDHVFLYDEVVENMLARPQPPYKRFPGVFPMWDNAARRQNGATIIHDSSPEKYGYWLKKVVERFKPYSPDENFIFINAWNEWAEGNHLEPCRKWGLKYLEETQKVFKNKKQDE
ncbi:MAG TPA: glycoside hydrolase family 99-like domain-containing protein [Bacteroidia bacterium]|nr:glycoside hydrolase family 99-like domain-containing protein [Bacteroidia bacterium]